MAYDDIRISELPSIPELHVNDLFLIQDVTNNLAHRIDWGRLKNSIGTLSKGIIFPLGTTEQPEIAIGDYTSGIMADDYGTFVIVTHGEKRLKINQSGTMELINGNVVIGNYDRQCLYSLIVNNITTFNCYTKFGDGAEIDGNLHVDGNITAGKNLNIPGNVILGTDCSNSLIINGQIRALCDMDLKGTMAIHEDLTVDETATINHNVSLGSNCSDKLDVYSNAWFRCDLRVDGDLTFGGDLVLDGDINIGSGCDNEINLNGTTTVLCDFRVKGDTSLEKDLFVFGDSNVTGNLTVSSDTQLGANCNNTTVINSMLTAECTSFFRDSVTIGDPNFSCPGTPLQVNGNLGVKCDILGDENLVIDHDTTLGTDCSDALLVKATPVFECDAEFQKSVTITDELFIGGDFTTNGHLIEIADPTTGCTNPNLINIHGEVHIDCNLFVSGSVFYDGDLQITGPDITFGAGCDLSTINLQGHTVAHCDMVVEGNTSPFALTVKKNLQVYENTELLGILNVAKDSVHDAKLFVHENVLLNLPVPALNYWEQCECIDGVMWGDSLNPAQGNQTNRAQSHTTFIHGTQKSLCQVYLNDPRWYKNCEGDARDGNNASAPHVQNTSIYGHLNSRSNVDLNSASADSATTNHKQITNVWAKLHQYSLVELNKGIDTATSACGFISSVHTTGTIEFNNHDNKKQTIIHGDLQSKKNVLLNTGCNQLTQVMGKFQTQCDVYLNGDFGSNNDTNCNKLTKIQGVQESFCDVYLNGQEATYASNGFKDCSKETIVWGKLYASCDQEFGNKSSVCEHTTFLHTNLMQDAKVELNKSAGCCTVSNQAFNSTTNNKCTIVHGDTEIKGSVLLNTNCGELTRVRGKFQVDCETHLRDKVVLNGDSKTCSNTTEINGVLNAHCNVNLNDSCSETTTIKGKLHSECDVQIDGNTIMDGTLLVKKDITGNSNLLIKGNTTLEGTLLVKGNSTLEGTLLVKKDITGEANLTIKGNSTLGSGCSNTTTVNSKLVAKCTVDIDGNLTAKGNATLGSGCPASIVTMNAKTMLKATELAGSLKAGGVWGGPGSGTAVPVEAMALTSAGTGEACGVSPKWTTIVNSISIPSGGALQEKANKKTGNLELDVAVCSDGGIEIDNSCGLKLSKNACPDWKNINLMTKRMYTWESGGDDKPGIMMGVKGALSGSVWVGLSANQNNGSFKATSGKGGVNADGNCGPTMGSNGDKILSVAQGYNVLPHHGTAGLISSGNKNNGVMVCFKYSSDGSSSGDSGINGGPPQGGGSFTRLAFDTENFVIGEGTKPPTGGGGNGGGGGGDGDKPFIDSRLADFDIDQQLEAFGGGFEQDELGLRSGDTPSVQWMMKPVDGDETLSYPFAYMDVDTLATKLPLFVNYTYKNSAFEEVANYDEYGTFDTWDHKLKPNLTEDDIEPGRLNYVGLHGLALAALVKQKRKLDDIYKNVELLESAKVSAPITFSDIIKIDLPSLTDAVDDAAADAAGVEVGQVYRNGSQLMVRVS